MCLRDTIYSHSLRGAIEKGTCGRGILWFSMLWEHWEARHESFANQRDVQEACRILAAQTVTKMAETENKAVKLE